MELEQNPVEQVAFYWEPVSYRGSNFLQVLEEVPSLSGFCPHFEELVKDSELSQ